MIKKIQSLPLSLLLLFSLLLIFIPSVNAVISRVQGPAYYSGNNVNSGIATLTNYPTIGNLLVCAVSIANSGASYGGVSSIVESNTTGWTCAGREYWTNNYARTEIWYNIVNGTYFGKAITVNVNVTVNYVLQFDIAEYTGLGLNVVVDKINATGITTTSVYVYTGNITTTTANELIIASIATYGGTGTQYSTITLPQNGFNLMDGGYGAYQSGYGAFAMFEYFATTINNYWTGASYGGSANKAVGMLIVSFKVNGGVYFSQNGQTSTESGVSSIFYINGSKIVNNLTPNGGFIFSYNDGSGYVNSSWIAFSGPNWNWCNTTKIINQTLGSTFYWTRYANDSLNIWSQSDIFSFTVQATVTFYFTEGGYLWRNSTNISNATTTTYTTATKIVMLAVENSQNGFLSFNWTNIISSTTINNYTFTVSNQSTLWGYMNMTYPTFNGNATINKVFNNQTFYSTSNVLQTGTYVQPTPFPFNGNATINTVFKNQTFYSNTSTLLYGNYTLSSQIIETDNPQIIVAIIITCLFTALFVGIIITKNKRR